MSAEYRVRVRYTEPMIRQTLLTYIRRRFFSGHLIVLWTLFFLTAFVGFQLAIDDCSPLFDMTFGALISFPIFLVILWRNDYVTRINRLRKLNLLEAEFIFTDESLTVVSALSTVVFSWKYFTEVWEFPQFWMLFWSLNEYLTLPADICSPEIKEFLRSKLPLSPH